MTDYIRFLHLFLICWFPLVLQAQFTPIPDSNFEQRLIDLGIDTSAAPDGQISTTAANAMTGTLDVSDLNIQDLTGIEAFTSILELDCSSNQIDSLDLSFLTNLKQVDCSLSSLLSLKLGIGNNLESLVCYANFLTELDLTGQSNLEYLDCRNNLLHELDLHNQTELYDLNAIGNYFEYLDVSHLEDLLFLSFSIGRRAFVDLSLNSNLITLNIECLATTTIDLTNSHYLLNSLYVGAFSNCCIMVDDVMDFETRFSETTPGVTFNEDCVSCNQVNFWRGGTGSWSNRYNWSFERVPIPCDDVDINGPYADVIVPGGFTAIAASLALHHGSKISIHSNATLQINANPSIFTRSGLYVHGDGHVMNNGTIDIENANQYGIHLGAGNMTNNGSISITNYGITTDEPSGLHINGGSAATNNGHITITGTITKPDNNGLRIANNASMHNTASGTISIHDISGMQADAVDNLGVLVNDGSIEVDSVAEGYGLLNAMNGTGYYAGSGELQVDRIPNGMGVLNDTAAIWRGSNNISSTESFTSHGIISAGNSPGVISVVGNYRKESGSIDSIEIFGRGGAGHPAGHDQIQVDGDLTLAGILQVETDSSFEAGDKESMILYSYTGALTGSFDSIKFDGLVPWEIDYSIPGIVRLVAPPCGHPDFETLMVFYDSLDGEHWLENNGWVEGANSISCDPCGDSWYGLTCKNGRVVSLDLPSNNLNGKLPSLRGLDSLKRLDLSSNDLSGGIDSISLLNELRHLNLAENNLIGMVPAEIFSLPVIEQIDLSLNGFDSLAVELQPSESLHTIKLNNNVNLHSTLPQSFPYMPNLDTLHLQACDFYNCFPTSYYRLCGREVDFTDNLLPDFISYCENEGEGSCNLCEEGPMTVDDTPIAPNTFLKVAGGISSAGTIVESKVIFHSNEYIEFHPGFSVDSSSVFISEIVPCGYE